MYRIKISNCSSTTYEWSKWDLLKSFPKWDVAFSSISAIWQCTGKNSSNRENGIPHSSRMIKSSHCQGERTESITESSSDLIHWLREIPHLFYQNAVAHDCLLLGVAVADFSTMARQRNVCATLNSVLCVWWLAYQIWKMRDSYP